MVDKEGFAMEMWLYILDLVGVFTFSVYGSYVGLKQKYDIFGVALIGFITALGGGTLREVIIGDVPAYYTNNSYIVSVVAGVAFAALVNARFSRQNKLFLVLDSLGLVVFALIGAARADELGLGLVGVVFSAMMTAFAGGLMRDIIVRVKPEVLHRDLYATTAAGIGLVYWLFRDSLDRPIETAVIIAIFLCIRLITLHKRVNLWKPNK